MAQAQQDNGHGRAVLWDLDGTLIDSGSQHYQAWRETLAGEGIEISYENFASTFGQRNDLVLRRIFGPGISAEEITRIAGAKERRYREIVRSQGVAFLPGAEGWLQSLRAAGWKQALVTSAPRANVNVIVAALSAQSYFETIVASEDVAHGKPDPEVFLLAAQRLQVPVARCVVVEDAPAGIEGARRAGISSVGIGEHAGITGADRRFRDLTELPHDLFERIIST